MISFSPSARRSLTWASWERSPISSRKIVPALGQLELPGLFGLGVGEGALDVAEEFGLDERRGDRAAVDDDERLVLSRAVVVDALATSSLPVPLSPVMSTVPSTLAIFSMSWKTDPILGPMPTMLAKRKRETSSVLRASTSPASFLTSAMRETVRRSSSLSIGFSR